VCVSHIPAEVTLEAAPCPNGCASGDDLLFTAQDRLFGLPGRFPVVRCCTCGLIRTEPRPTPETIRFYYPDNTYCAYVLSPGHPGPASLLRRCLRSLYCRAFRVNNYVLPDIPPGRMLEVGCATGSFLAEMKAKSWAVEGIEPSKSAAVRAQAAGLNVFCGTLESAPDPRRPFDLAVGWMVVEHLHQPLMALRKLAGWVRPEGWLVISVPDAGRLHLRLFKDRWFALQVPTHLYHFTEESITALLRKAGWHVERVFHHRSLFNCAYSISYVLEDGGAPKCVCEFPRQVVGRPLGRLALYPAAYVLAALKQTGLITLWARRGAAVS